MYPHGLLARLRHDLLDILYHGLTRASADGLVARALATPPAPLGEGPGALRVVAAGKAARAMARAFTAWAGPRCAGGLVVAPPGGPGARPVPGLEEIVASHPAPDGRSEDAGRRALALARAAAAAGDTLVVLLSGGASSLMALAAPGLALEDKSEASRALMHAGAAIDELNAVRKHLSAIKGGRLAAAAGATVTLAISDVVAPVADDPCVIGSGPTVPDPTTFADALAALDRFALRGRVPPAVVALLERGAGGEVEETIKAGDARLARASFHVIGSRLDALAGARERAAALGYTVVEVPEPLVGEAREAGARLARRAAAAGAPRVCVLAAGETTVRVRGRGRGGRESGAGARRRARRAGAPGMGAGERRHRRCRRPHRRRRRHRRSDDARARRGVGLDPRRFLDGQRRLPVLRAPRRSHQDRSDGHQRGGRAGGAVRLTLDAVGQRSAVRKSVLSRLQRRRRCLTPDP